MILDESIFTNQSIENSIIVASGEKIQVQSVDEQQSATKLVYFLSRNAARVLPDKENTEDFLGINFFSPGLIAAYY